MPLGDRTILSTREFPHSRERVYRAITDPDLLRQWWGPAGFSNTFEVCDVRPGGAWRFTMHGPDGTDYWNESEWAELVPPKRIVLIHLRPMHRFELAMTLDEIPTGTRLTWRMTFDSREERDRILPYVPAANEQNFDRLSAVLSQGERQA
jgi:uncharacterized protein YndB with AHSA1/START domain